MSDSDVIVVGVGGMGNREPGPADETPLRDFTERYFPDAAGPTMTLKTCLFTNSPDEHFIIDIHPDHPQVVVAAGFSGHGFKFASVVGEILADLAVTGSTTSRCSAGIVPAWPSDPSLDPVDHRHQRQVLGCHPTLGVCRQGEGHPVPPDQDVGVMIGILGHLGDLVDEPHRPGEVGEREGPGQLARDM